MAMSFLFRRKKYVLYCKDSTDTKEWTPIAEFDRPISLIEARAYGEDCYQLRLEERDPKSDKRIKLVWVEPPKRKQKTPSLSDLLLEAGMLAQAVASVNKVFIDAFRNIVTPQQQQQQSYSLKDLADLVRGMSELAKLVTDKRLPLPFSLPIDGNEKSAPNIEPDKLREIEQKLLEDIAKDMEDAENAPCAKNEYGECVEQ